MRWFSSLLRMESKTRKIIKARKQLSKFTFLRGMFQPAKALHFFLVLSCTLLCLTTCEPCSVNRMPETEEYDGCEYYGDNHHVGYTDSGYDRGISMTRFSAESV